MPSGWMRSSTSAATAVNSHAPEGNAAVRCDGRERAAADIALRCPARAAVGDRELLAASATAEQARKQSLATPDRTRSHLTLPVCIIRGKTCVLLGLSPCRRAFLSI